MADQNPEVKEFVEHGEFTPTEGDDELIEPTETETPSESSTENNEDVAEPEAEEPKEELRERVRSKSTEPESVNQPKPVEGETPRERALRREVEKLKKQRRDDRSKELFTGPEPIKSVQPEPASDDELLSRYDQTELKNLEEVIDVIAKKKGWVRNEELQATSYKQTATDVLDEFLASHPMYLPEQDSDNILWNQFQSEFSLYKTPENPKEYKRIFQKIHNEILGVRQLDEDPKLKAQDEKIKAASHAGGKQGMNTKASKTPNAPLDQSFRP